MTVFGQATVTRFAKRHAGSRKPLKRFLEIAEAAVWPHFPAVRETFPATDYAPATGTLIFDIAGNKYRLIAKVDFETQEIVIVKAMTHAEYDREEL